MSNKIAETRAEFEAYDKELDTCTDDARIAHIHEQAKACDQLMIYSWEGRYDNKEWADLNKLVGQVVVRSYPCPPDLHAEDTSV